MKKIGTIFFAAVLGIGLVLGGIPSVYAQEVSGEEFILEEIMVTAQKREEKLQEVTVSASVLSEDNIIDSNASYITDLNLLVPSVQFKGSISGRTPVAMRGISTNAEQTNLGLTYGVSMLLDGVPVPSDSMGVNHEFGDIQRIEILKGPQSTLGGRAASAGVINIVTRAPRDTFGGTVTLLASEDGEYGANGFISGPLSDTVKFSLFGNALQKEYPAVHTITGKNSESESMSARAKLLFEPNEDLSVQLTGHFSEYESSGSNFTFQYMDGTAVFPFIPYPPDQPMPPTTFGIPFETAYPGLDMTWGNVEYNSINPPMEAEVEDIDFSMTVDYSLGDYTISSITAYQEEDRMNNQDITLANVYWWNTLIGVPPDAPPAWNQMQTVWGDIESFSQELKVASPVEDPINFVAGVFYSDVDVIVSQLRNFPGYPMDFRRNAITKTLAAYGRVNWGLGEDTTLVTGLRYNRDDLSFQVDQHTSADNPGTTFISPLAEDTSSATVGDVSLQHQLNPVLMVYGTYARGYKPKVYNTGVTLDSNDPLEPPVEQEKINHFEIGSKGAYFNGNLIVNMAIFNTIYENYQIQIFDITQVVPLLELKAAGEAETRGIELDLYALPSPDLKFTLNAAYIDAKFNKFPNAPTYPGQTEEQGAVDGMQDLAGEPMPDAPKFKATISAEKIISVDALSFDLKLGAQYAYRTEAPMIANQNPEAIQDAFGILNANITATTWSGTHSLTLFVNNVFDEFYLADGADFWSGLFGSGNAVIGHAPRGAVRYAGLRYTLNF